MALTRINLHPAATPCSFVMAGLVQGLHDFPHPDADVDGRDKPGHDDKRQGMA
jgi:hypothetical protein